jgi:hypothetical protein
MMNSRDSCGLRPSRRSYKEGGEDAGLEVKIHAHYVLRVGRLLGEEKPKELTIGACASFCRQFPLIHHIDCVFESLIPDWSNSDEYRWDKREKGCYDRTEYNFNSLIQVNDLLINVTIVIQSKSSIDLLILLNE